MNTIYLRAYKQKVQAVTYKTALPHHKLFIQYFRSKPLKGITTRDCESVRLHIIEYTGSHWFNALDQTVSEEITQNIKSAGLDSILCQNSCQTSNL